MSALDSPPILLAAAVELSSWLSVATALLAIVLLRRSGRNLMRRRNAEAALRQLHELHSRILASLPMGMYTYRLDPDGRLILTYANPAADRILGFDHSGMAGKPIEEVFPALAHTEAPQKIRQVAATGQSWFCPRFEYYEERFGGVYEVHAFRIHPGEAAVLFCDVTHRCQVEDRLQEYYFINDAIIESSPAGIAAIDRDRNLILWNPACERMFGWKAQEILGRPMLFLPESERPESLRIQDRTLAGESMRDLEVVRHRKDGTLFPLSLSTAPLYNARGEIIGAMALMLDLTERRAAERALEVSEARWQRFIETVQEGVWMSDGRDAVVFVNDQLLALMGYRREEVIGVHVLEFIAAEWRAFAAQKLEELKRGEKHRLELALRRKDGTPLHAIVSASPQWNEKGAFDGLLGTVSDITGQKAEAEELRRHRDLLAALVRTQAAFIAGESAQRVFEPLLEALVRMTGSEFGFIGEVFEQEAGAPYLVIRSFSPHLRNSPAFDALYDRLVRRGMQFSSPHSLLGAALAEASLLIANDAQRDPRGAGFPPGHPEVRHFLGIPLRYGNERIGLIGLANRPGGYNEETERLVAPLVGECATAILALRHSVVHASRSEEVRRRL